MSNPLLHSIEFRNAGPDQCAIRLAGERLGDVFRLRDIFEDPDKFLYQIHFYDDYRGPRTVHHKRDIRRTAADMIRRRGLADHLGF